MPFLSRANVEKGAVFGAAALAALAIEDANAQRTVLSPDQLIAGMPVGVSDLPSDRIRIKYLSSDEVTALADAAKRQITQPHCDVLVDTVVDRALLDKGHGTPVSTEITDQLKLLFRNGGQTINCSGPSRVIRVSTLLQAGFVGEAINEASRKLGVNLWSRYGFTLSVPRPVATGQKISDATPALK